MTNAVIERAINIVTIKHSSNLLDEPAVHDFSDEYLRPQFESSHRGRSRYETAQLKGKIK